MIDLTDRSFSAFYHPQSGVTYNQGTMNVTLFNSRTNQQETVQLTPSEMVTLFGQTRSGNCPCVKLWDTGLLNGGYVKEYHRSLMFDAHSFVLNDFSRNPSLVDFSFKMIYGFVVDSIKDKSKTIRENYRDDYWLVKATIQRSYSPSVLYRSILGQSLPHSYFGGVLYALDYLTYLILNEKTPTDLNHRLIPIVLPTVAALPIMKQSFSFDRDQTIDPLLIPYDQLVVA